MSLTTCPLLFAYYQTYHSPIPSQFASSREGLNKYNAGWVIEPNAISMPPNFFRRPSAFMGKERNRIHEPSPKSRIQAEH